LADNRDLADEIRQAVLESKGLASAKRAQESAEAQAVGAGA
jgi:hypothetical protein